jgi:hypothetical protein
VPATATRPPSPLLVGGLALPSLSVFPLPRDGCGWGAAAGGGQEAACGRYRANLGGAILLGLELLVAADIANTAARPLDLRAVGALGLVVLIRTFRSFSLQVAIKGRWPWRDGGERPGPPPPGGEGRGVSARGRRRAASPIAAASPQRSATCAATASSSHSSPTPGASGMRSIPSLTS